MVQAGRRATAPKTVITPRRGWFHLDLGELWRYRELGYFLAWRDVKVRYKQTVIGASWAVIQPLVLMVVFTAVFGRLGRGADEIPREFPIPIFYFSALLPWSYFSQAMGASSASIVASHHMITKIYFPRLLLPLALTFPAVIDFVMSSLVLAGMMFAYGVPFTARLFVIPPLFILAALTAFAIGTWLSATNALYRDVREGIPFFIQILLFTSPILLSKDRIPESIERVYGLNPMAVVIEGCRWAVTGIGTFPWQWLGSGIAAAVFLLITGVIYFRRIEDVIVDVV